MSGVLTAASYRPAHLRTVGYYLIIFALGMSTAMVGPTLGALAGQVGVSLGSISAIFVVRAIGRLVGTLIAGHSYDRYPGHLIMVSALTAGALMLLTIPHLGDLLLLSAIMWALGFTEGFVDVGLNAMLIWNYRERSTPYFTALHFFFGFGAFTAPWIFAPVVSETLLIYTLLALGLLLPAFILMMVSSPPPYQQTADAPPHIIAPAGILPFFVFMFFIYVGTEATYAGWVFSYATVSGLMNSASASELTSLFWGTQTIGRLLAVWLSRRITPERYIMLCYSGALTAMLLIAALPQSIVYWTALLGLSMAATFPMQFNLARSSMTITGGVTSMIFVGGNLGFMIVPTLVGQFFERVGPQALPLVLIVQLAAGLAAFSVLRIKLRSLR